MFRWLTSSLTPSSRSIPRSREDLIINEDETRARARRNYVEYEHARAIGSHAPDVLAHAQPLNRLY